MNFAEPGDREILTIEPAWLEQVQARDENGTAKFLLSVDAALSSTAKFEFDGQESGRLGAFTSADEVAAAVADVLPGSASVEVVAVESGASLFEVASQFRITVSNAPANVGDLSFDTSSFLVKQFETIEEVRTGEDYVSPGQSPQNVQVIRSLLDDGHFKIGHGNNQTNNIAHNADASTVANAIESLLSRNDFTVTTNNVQGVRTWKVAFNEGATDTPTLTVDSDTEKTQSAKGFNGSLRNMTAVKYGAGINRITGSESSIDTTTSVADIDQPRRCFIQRLHQCDVRQRHSVGRRHDRSWR